MNPLLFPNHFLQATFPTLGGKAVAVHRAGNLVAFVLLFPRGLEGERRKYTARFHPLPLVSDLDLEAVVARARQVFPDEELVGYDPRLPQPYEATVIGVPGGLEIGCPDATEALAARRLQQRIWESLEEDLYPSDLFSRTFRAATSLVARVDVRVAGFLFGFYKFGGGALPACWLRHQGPLRIESQVAGVDPALQGQSIGFQLKKVQAGEALRQGIEVITWTVDPLQLPNAKLNFGKLGAVSCRLFRNHYPFTNKKNKVPASRLEITWMLASARVRGMLASEPSQSRVVDLGGASDTTFVNDGCEPILSAAPSRWIAIEIPEDWTALQEDDLETARRWRATTDELLAAYLGVEEDRYAITDVGHRGGRWYLLGRRIASLAQDPAFS